MEYKLAESEDKFGSIAPDTQRDSDERACLPLFYATRLLADGTPDEWREYLPASYAHHDEHNLALYVASEASKHVLAWYGESDAERYWRFLRRAWGTCSLQKIRKSARELLDDDDEPASAIIARQRDQIQALLAEIEQLKMQLRCHRLGSVYDWNNNVRANGEYHE